MKSENFCDLTFNLNYLRYELIKAHYLTSFAGFYNRLLIRRVFRVVTNFIGSGYAGQINRYII